MSAADFTDRCVRESDRLNKRLVYHRGLELYYEPITTLIDCSSAICFKQVICQSRKLEAIRVTIREREETRRRLLESGENETTRQKKTIAETSSNIWTAASANSVD